MRALSISRPWAELILRGKSVENRTWNTAYRGPLLLHTAHSWAAQGVSYAEHVGRQLDRDFVAGMARTAAGHPTGIVGVAELVDVCSVARFGEPCSCGPWAMDAHCHWRLANVRRLNRPVYCRGALGLWVPPVEVVEQVHAQLDAQAAMAATFGAGA